ncbi:ABC transporter permease [Microbacterium sediminicola]|uniref:ABC transporter permease n=1 Tax=Microbacterium sediminicola TaxID=415210 RepID=A0ABP4UAM9_9MICO
MSPSPSAVRAVGLVARREIGSKLRSKVFVISTAILLLGALAAVVWGGFQAQTVLTTSVAVTSDTSAEVSAIPNVSVTEAPNPDAATALVESGTVDAAVVPDSSSPVGVSVIATESAPQQLILALGTFPTVTLLDPAPGDDIAQYIVSIAFGIVFLLAASVFGGTIAQSVVEEKQTRVVELLISAIPTRALLAGKVLGNTVLAMAQIIAMAAIGVLGVSVTGQSVALDGIGPAIAWFAVFFLFGFILLASLFAAAGALVSRQEDVGATTTPLTMLILIPYFLVIFAHDNPLVLAIMSYVPFSAPVGMPVRIFTGEAQWWEPIVSLVILIATCAAAVAIGARIYENSVLRMGARVRWRDALKR